MPAAQAAHPAVMRRRLSLSRRPGLWAVTVVGKTVEGDPVEIMLSVNRTRDLPRAVLTAWKLAGRVSGLTRDSHQMLFDKLREHGIHVTDTAYSGATTNARGSVV